MQAHLCCVPFVLGAALLAQSSTDLRLWTPEHYNTGAGNWVVASDGTSVTQTLNGWPTLFHSDFDVQNLRIEGSLTVTGSDDDYVGFALGFRPGDCTNPSARYLLIDWKAVTQNYNFGSPSCTPGTTAQRGLAVSLVEGVPTADELWGHVNLDTEPCSGPTDRVTELQRAFQLGNTGWVRNRLYSFRFDFTATQLEVFVDGILELRVAGTFGNGRMAFYNFSQSGVVYSAFRSDCLPSWDNYGSGYPGSMGVPTLSAGALPVLGTTIEIHMGSVGTAPAFGLLAWGWAPANEPSGFGGTILVRTEFVEGVVAPAGPSTGTTQLRIPLDPRLCGRRVYGQFAHLDTDASHGFAFSPGMYLHCGN